MKKKKVYGATASTQERIHWHAVASALCRVQAELLKPALTFARISPQLIEKKKETKHTSPSDIAFREIGALCLRGGGIISIRNEIPRPVTLIVQARGNAGTRCSFQRERISRLRHSEEDVYHSAKGSFAAVTAGGCSVESG